MQVLAKPSTLILSLHVLVALIFSGLAFYDYDEALEYRTGLPVLLLIRNHIFGTAPPNDVVVVELNRDSFIDSPLLHECMQQTQGKIEMRCFNRRLQAELINTANTSGARLIIANFLYKEPRGSDDEVLAQAIQKSGRVLLQSILEYRLMGDGVETNSLSPPIAELDQVAASAPFIFQEYQGAKQQTFVSALEPDATAFRPQTRASLPILALHLLVLQSYRTELQAILAPHFPELASFLNAQTGSVNHRATLESLTDQLLRAAIDKPALFDDLAQSAKTEPTKALLSALFACYSQGDQITLNFYGPEHTVHTIAYHDLSQVLTIQPNYLRDKIVIFGPSVDLGREAKGATIDNGFSLISSTELLATSIANLKAQKLLNRPDKIAIGLSYSVLTLGSLLLSMVCRPNKLLSYLALFGLGYFGLTLIMINYFNIWLPYLLILAQLTAIAFIHSAQQYANKRHQLSQIYQHKIPAPLLNDFNNGQSAQHEDGKRYTGISFATDGEGFTQLGASKGEQWLAQFMQAYQPMVERCIREHQGTVKDWAGDGMLAIWLDKQPPKTNTLRQRPSQITDKNLSHDIRHQALCAALALTRAVADFNQNYGVSFPIRIGINYGPFWLSFNQDLKVFGDTVNASSRLEHLNKTLKTHILVSKEIITEPSAFTFRYLGEFQLRGHASTAPVYELIGLTEQLPAETLDFITRFQIAILNFENENYQLALKALTQLYYENFKDGPTEYYLTLCKAKTFTNN